MSMPPFDRDVTTPMLFVGLAYCTASSKCRSCLNSIEVVVHGVARLIVVTVYLRIHDGPGAVAELIPAYDVRNVSLFGSINWWPKQPLSLVHRAARDRLEILCHAGMRIHALHLEFASLEQRAWRASPSVSFDSWVWNPNSSLQQVLRGETHPKTGVVRLSSPPESYRLSRITPT